jgi:hypothetical protein
MVVWSVQQHIGTNEHWEVDCVIIALKYSPFPLPRERGEIAKGIDWIRVSERGVALDRGENPKANEEEGN